MTETIARRDDPAVPLLMPVLLSLVAGYLDSYTYLSLFGLFAAQVTGSFVIAGAEFVTSDNARLCECARPAGHRARHRLRISPWRRGWRARLRHHGFAWGARRRRHRRRANVM